MRFTYSVSANSGAVALAMAAVVLLGQDKPRTALDGVYTADQAKRGAETYAAKCAECHGGEMQGGPAAPSMAGEEFLFSWGGKSAGALYDYLHMNMPPGDPGGLGDQRYAEIIAAIFQKNGFPAGKTELPGDPSALAKIQIPRDKP
jgi:mono/diheme cytochrome c family protein